MAEIVPVVYDIAQPTPVSLKDLSAIAVSLEICRNEIRKRRTKSAIVRLFTPLTFDISSKTVLDRDLPLVIYDVIDKFIPRFGPSVYNWLDSHRCMLQLYRTNRNSVLEVFDDFVADYCGTIDYVRTAKRILVCDTFNEVEKSVVACLYFFEQDIWRIWPSVCWSSDLFSMDFRQCQQLYYWICSLHVPYRRNRFFVEVMHDYHIFHNRPSAEYFWHFLSHEKQLEQAVNIFSRDLKLFVTFVLSKLNDQQLDEFVNIYGCELILNLRINHTWFFQPTWKLIRNKMNQSTLTTLVIEMLKLERTFDFEWCTKECHKWMYFCSEIWNGIAPDLKRWIAEDILYDWELFENNPPFSCSNICFVGFLLIILSSATFEDRSTFWLDCWPHLIGGTRSKDLLKIMKLCFANEEEIAQFKANILAESENVRIWCNELLSAGMLDELNDSVDFYCPEVQTAKIFKQRLLRSTFNCEDNRFIDAILSKVKEFSVFIDNSFDSADESEFFKAQLMYSPVMLNFFRRSPCSMLTRFEAVTELVDTFLSLEQSVRMMKMDMMSLLARFILQIRDCRDFIERRFKNPIFDHFLLRLLGSADEVERFKQTHLKLIELCQRYG